MAGSREQIGRHCPYCGAIITVDEYFCRACHKRLHDQQDFSAPSTLKPETLAVSVRNPFITGLLSLISPGLGQFYNGDTLKGLAIFTGFIAVSFIGYVSFLALDELQRWLIPWKGLQAV